MCELVVSASIGARDVRAIGGKRYTYPPSEKACECDQNALPRQTYFWNVDLHAPDWRSCGGIGLDNARP